MQRPAISPTPRQSEPTALKRFDSPTSLFFVAPLIPGSRNLKRQVAVELTDDSLSDVGLGRGSIVICELDPTPYFDRLVAVLTDEGIKVRYIMKRKDHYLLCPKNEDFPVERVKTLEVLGYVHSYPEDVQSPSREPVTEKAIVLRPKVASWRNRPVVAKSKAYGAFLLMFLNYFNFIIYSNYA